MTVKAADRCKLPQAFWGAIKAVNLSPAQVLRAAHLPSSLAVDGSQLLTTAQYFALWRALEQLSPEPGLGLRMVQATDTAVHPPAILAAFHARDYRDGLARIARFKRLCTPEELSIVEKNGECAISTRWLYASEPEPPIATEVAFATLVELGRRATGQPIAPLRLELTRKKSANEQIPDYFKCPIKYRSGANVLVLKSDDLDRPFLGYNPELLDMLTPTLASALGELEARSSASEQVKIVVKQRLASGRPELHDVAEELGLSERTLQRRITEEGNSYRELVVVARQELVRQLLSDSKADLNEVACLLGFQDKSSFYRAFREWEGTTPNRYRESLLGAHQLN